MASRAERFGAKQTASNGTPGQGFSLDKIRNRA